MEEESLGDVGNLEALEDIDNNLMGQQDDGEHKEDHQIDLDTAKKAEK